jgi:small conductance mechanosensitive channel
LKLIKDFDSITVILTQMENELAQINNVMNVASELTVTYGFQFVGAIIILIVGWQVGKWVGRLTLRLCERANLDITLSRFFSSIAKTLVLVFVVIIALGKFGITIAPFIAALGAIAFGGTLALQGPLSNYGAGFTIILTRPFVVGDTIRIQGVTGIVDEIKLAYTRLSNEDGEVITIPNKQIIGEIISNTFANLLVESRIRIKYADNPDTTVETIRNILLNHPEVAREPAPLVGIENFGDSGYELGLRYWLPTKRYYELLYSINGEICRQLNQQGIRFAMPQLDVHVPGNKII